MSFERINHGRASAGEYYYSIGKPVEDYYIKKKTGCEKNISEDILLKYSTGAYIPILINLFYSSDDFIKER